MSYVQYNISTDNPVEKEALAFMMGCLSEEIYSSNVKDNIPSFLETNIMGDFESPIGFLRKRACWMYGALCAKQFGTEI